jgi:hypothetical protein
MSTGAVCPSQTKSLASKTAVGRGFTVRVAELLLLGLRLQFGLEVVMVMLVTMAGCLEDS